MSHMSTYIQGIGPIQEHQYQEACLMGDLFLETTSHSISAAYLPSSAVAEDKNAKVDRSKFVEFHE